MSDLLLAPLGNGLDIGNVESFDSDLVRAVLLGKGVESVLATTDGNDVDAGVNHALGQRLANAGCGAGNENVLVWERHLCCWCYMPVGQCYGRVMEGGSQVRVNIKWSMIVSISEVAARFRTLQIMTGTLLTAALCSHGGPEGQAVETVDVRDFTRRVH